MTQAQWDADKDREAELEDSLKAYSSSPQLIVLEQLLTLRRIRYRAKLEKHDDPEARGRARECKELLHLVATSASL
jgi:hypothetical protein